MRVFIFKYYGELTNELYTVVSGSQETAWNHVRDEHNHMLGSTEYEAPDTWEEATDVWGPWEVTELELYAGSMHVAGYAVH